MVNIIYDFVVKKLNMRNESLMWGVNNLNSFSCSPLSVPLFLVENQRDSLINGVNK